MRLAGYQIEALALLYMFRGLVSTCFCLEERKGAKTAANLTQKQFFYDCSVSRQPNRLKIAPDLSRVVRLSFTNFHSKSSNEKKVMAVFPFEKRAISDTEPLNVWKCAVAHPSNLRIFTSP